MLSGEFYFANGRSYTFKICRATPKAVIVEVVEEHGATHGSTGKRALKERSTYFAAQYDMNRGLIVNGRRVSSITGAGFYKIKDSLTLPQAKARFDELITVPFGSL